jgi:hypothetical protein
MTLQLVPAELAHAEAIGANLRAGDLAEILAMGYERGTDAVKHCISTSEDATIVLERGVPIAGFGQQPDAYRMSGTTYVWCMTTPAVERHKKDILWLSREFCAATLQRYFRLISSTSPIYPEAVRWTKWLGFETFSEETVNGVLFYNIVKTR